jgi:hypothetical protein
MADDMVMRSVYLRPRDDTELRQLAHEMQVSKNDLIRSAIQSKLEEWRDDSDVLERDLRLGRRDSAARGQSTSAENVIEVSPEGGSRIVERRTSREAAFS